MSQNPKHERMDPKEIAEIMDSVSEKIPTLIKGVLDSFFSPEAAANIGKSVAVFRKSLIEGGISESEAQDMTREYLQTLTKWSSVMREARINTRDE
jgi:hypothetical protein